ncbi:uncharacterized protein LOC117528184 [Thalassophryne amazonica]|uniref:uncharacterized protein LOC117528184 n=1 Tax=Thalassophryne amazonica TaxID=390379 RepID=UPI001472206B|nr:uncharacterized protein LOC117528184 [Thalassophryne amazonica]
MGSQPSTVDYDSKGLELYQAASRSPNFLPDIGIDESLVKYSGTDSSTVLEDYSTQLKVAKVPGYIDRLGSILGPKTRAPNAVGLGALVISMIMEMVFTSTQTSENSYSMIQRIFGEEKASRVRDTMLEYVKRHKMFMDNQQALLKELGRLEKKLSNQLTTLRNSLLYDGEIKTRGFKIWVNGAAFHVQMLIHEARLGAGKASSNLTNPIKVAISEYLQDLDKLLDKYKTYMISNTFVVDIKQCSSRGCSNTIWQLRQKHDPNRRAHIPSKPDESWLDPDLIKSYANAVFSNYKPLTNLKTHFINIQDNLDELIKQHHIFSLPSEDNV